MIQAIETVYKGFRFRSRLEARWAVFFDRMGWNWAYEHQGFDLESGRYLPDFEVTVDGVAIFVEIKPKPVPAHPFPKVYLAGRMTNWRPLPYSITRAGVLGVKAPEKPAHLFDRPIKYVGPYFAEDNHGFNRRHGIDDALDSSGTCAKAIFQRSLRGIQQADVIFAYLEDREAFGSLVEIGMALGQKQHLCIGICGDESLWHDLWFAGVAAAAKANGTECFVSPSRDAVLHSFKQYLGRYFPEPKEQVKAREVADSAGVPSIVMYGDPIDALHEGDGGWVRFGGAPEFLTDRASTESAALDARQARFEHGQSGARAYA
jgi:hypothetical protein